VITQQEIVDVLVICHHGRRPCAWDWRVEHHESTGCVLQAILGAPGGFILWSGHRGHMLALDESVEILGNFKIKTRI
jgi:hypothetical protein